MHFQTLFGMEQNNIQSTCLLTPFLHKDQTKKLGLPSLSKGARFNCGQHPNFTFIHTHIGAHNVGDCAYYLRQSPCERIIFIGACGLVTKTEQLDIGSLVTVHKALNYESFSSLLNKTPSKLEQNIPPSDNLTLPSVTCASFGSIALQNQYHDQLLKNKIEALDMECCALISVAQNHMKVFPILYVTDILDSQPLFSIQSQEYNTTIRQAQLSAIKTALNCIHDKRFTNN